MSWMATPRPVPTPAPTPAPEAPTDEVKVSVLDSSHRCVIYGCNAQAYVRAAVEYDGDTDTFDYCSHHWTECEFKVGMVAKAIHDERWRLEDVSKLDVSA